MLRWLADENFSTHVVHAVRQRWPEIDILRAQDIGLTETPDDKLLEWAARNERVLLSRDKATLVEFATERVRRGERMCGVFIVHTNAGNLEVAEQIAILTLCSREGEWENQVSWLPL
jgi:predicted nuclease of predicted toxin-antitoxin system